jgi:F-type H+-transporting ATPase subunit epsilon
MPLQVEVVSPEKVLFSGEATQVITRVMGGGEIAFLSGHAPYLGALVENHTRIHLADGQVQDVAVHGGFVQVGADRVSILSDEAELAEDIDVARAREAASRAEERIRSTDDAEAEAALRRAHARITAAGGLPGSGH